jgi:antitoxin (DNA-binding transcriptional repressor) of toxin-antitoxin stability system
MTRVGLRELESNANDLVRRVREQGEVIDITYCGEVAARLVPIHQTTPTAEEQQALWGELDQLAAEVSATWPEEVSAAEAVHTERRTL